MLFRSRDGVILQIVSYCGKTTATLARFLRFLKTELLARRATPKSTKLFIVIDGFAALRDEFSDPSDMDLWANLMRAYAEGPAVGMHFMVSTNRAKNIPSAIADVTLQSWVYQLSDRYDYSTFGVRGTNIPMPVPGRCVNTRTLRQMHIATPAVGVQRAIQALQKQYESYAPVADIIGLLPTEVYRSQLPAPDYGADRWFIPVGIAESTLQPAGLELYPQEHALLAASPRSGKSTLLAAIAQQLLTERAKNPQNMLLPDLVIVCDQRSPLRTFAYGDYSCNASQFALMADTLLNEGRDRPVLVLVDDAERIDDSAGLLQKIFKGTYEHIHVIAAGRAVDLRANYSHWNKEMRKSRTGGLIQPVLETDYDFFGSIPRRVPVALGPGRGFIFNSGQREIVQLMRPDGDSSGV